MMAAPLAFSLLFSCSCINSCRYSWPPRSQGSPIAAWPLRGEHDGWLDPPDAFPRVPLHYFADERHSPDFQYHGAEHKVVFNFESGQPVTVGKRAEFVTFHPRCGTSFLLLVMVIAILVVPLLPFDGFRREN